MKKSAALLCCLLALSGYLRANEALSEEAFEVRQQNYKYSTLFDFSTPSKYLGTVVKSYFRVRTNYDLYDSQGNYEANGICRIFSFRVFHTRGTKIDVYDPDGCKIGLISGQLFTGASAKFNIENAEGERIAIAYLDKTKAGFTIVHPENQNRYFARLIRHFIADTIDHWHVKIYEPLIDPRLIKVFAAFVVDCQGDFKADH